VNCPDADRKRYIADFLPNQQLSTASSSKSYAKAIGYPPRPKGSKFFSYDVFDHSFYKSTVEGQVQQGTSFFPLISKSSAQVITL
jgi:hypothetical protein